MAKKKTLDTAEPAETFIDETTFVEDQASVEKVAEPEPPKKCAFIDEKGVYRGMVDVPEEPTERHLLDIPECDLPVGEYIWSEGTFQPIKSRNNANTLAYDALVASVTLLQKNDIEVPLEVLIWVKQLKTQLEA